MWSYCSKSGPRERRLGEASSASSVAAVSPGRSGVGASGWRARRAGDHVARAVVGEEAGRDRADLLAVPEAAQHAAVGDLADHRVVQLPAVAHGLDGLEEAGAHDRNHPLLALGDHDLPGLHAVLAARNAVEVHLDADLAGHLGEGGGETGGAAVLQRGDEAALGELHRDLDQLLAEERVADLDGRALIGVGIAELGRGQHRGTADAVAAGRRAEEDEQVALARRLRAHQPLDREETDAHRVDETVLAVRLVEGGVAADGGHADAVAVVADAGDGAVDLPAGLAEAQAVEQRHRACAHGDHVAQDAADPRCGALERLDGARVIVALDLERHGEAVAEVEHAGVLAGALQHAGALRRQPLEQRRRVLVAAVLGPEQAEDGQLEVVGLTLQQLLDARELSVCQTEGTMDRLFNGGSQNTSLARGPDGPSGRSLTRMSGHDRAGLRSAVDASLPGPVLILGGVALGSGVWQPGRRRMIGA